MAIALTMSHEDDKDDHVNDVVMPGFRFHPTEEELIEFYLRRKVKGKRFNVELITFLDLYQYDPWELPALATIGDKEWFFYVPRDRKYRNGDRPNRVTTSGYWKATGADRTIKNENSRSIGLKKTLVFYTGKAPKGIRTNWIMNEYRLSQHETDQFHKTEISLCRVYKRPGVEDHWNQPSSISSKPSLRGVQQSKKDNLAHRATNPQVNQQHSPPSSSDIEKLSDVGSTSTTDDQAAIGFATSRAYGTLPQTTLMSSPAAETDPIFVHHSKQVASFLPTGTCYLSASPTLTTTVTINELHRLIGYQQMCASHPSQILQLSLPHSQALQLNLPSSSLPTLQDKPWEWNPISEPNRDYCAYK